MFKPTTSKSRKDPSVYDAVAEVLRQKGYTPAKIEGGIHIESHGNAKAGRRFNSRSVSRVPTHYTYC